MAKTKIELVKDELYQVHNGKKGWVIARYDRRIEAHEEKYSTISFDFKHISGEKRRWVPTTHVFRHCGIESSMSNGIWIREADLDVRPVTDECRADLQRLRDACKTANEAHKAAMRELREFCS